MRKMRLEIMCSTNIFDKNNENFLLVSGKRVYLAIFSDFMH